MRMHNLTGRAILETHSAGDLTRQVQIAGDALNQVWPEIENSPVLSELLRANTAALSRLDADALWSMPNTAGVAPILFRSGQSLLKASLVAEAIAAFRDLDDGCRHRLGPEHPTTLAGQNNLAAASRRRVICRRRSRYWSRSSPSRRSWPA